MSTVSSTDIAMEFAPKGLNADVIRFISAKKNEPDWMLEMRLKAFERWQAMEEPTWAKVRYTPVDYQDLYYYAAPKKKDGLTSLDEIDPELLAVYAKLGIPLKEQEVLAGVVGAPKYAVDAVFDSVSVITTFKDELKKSGVIFCSISRLCANILICAAVSRQRGAGQRQLFRGAQCCRVFGWLLRLRAAGVRCPMELSTYFRINAENHRSVRAHPDHRRQGGLCVVSGRLHGAAARREPASRRRSRTGCAR